ncbi:uracil-DNA glycosylase [Thiolinea disciformis]|uniref:uracil-DNA glycosylase n=1 Tax=Thiolinea disciformis TaxID=125614 RepID=UPI000381790A|nr:uracil-DNA glycosylase [Thiolinea disciformis]
MDGQTRRHYLKAMGIPLWVPRAVETERIEEAEVSLTDVGAKSLDLSGTELEAPFDASAYAEYTQFQQKASLPDLSDFFKTEKTTPVLTPKTLVPLTAVPPDCTKMDWLSLEQSVSQCELCNLHKTRQRTVFGIGNQQASWMVIGEAPGAEEDRQGEPFVGRAGQLLNNMLAAIGLVREQIYIANILKCRPPNNRDPKPDEALLCRGYLERQIALVQPKLILVVGRIAAHNLLNTTQSLAKLRGQRHDLPHTQIPVVVTYHPAYLLRQPLDKRKAWQDLQFARQTLAR